LVGQWDVVRAAILGACGRQSDVACFQVDLRPPQRADLLAPLSGEDQEAHDLAVIRIRQRLPDNRQLAIRQHAVTRPFSVEMLVGPHHRVRLAQPFADRPGEE
jgi:hypothetical protein